MSYLFGAVAYILCVAILASWLLELFTVPAGQSAGHGGTSGSAFFQSGQSLGEITLTATALIITFVVIIVAIAAFYWFLKTAVRLCSRVTHWLTGILFAQYGYGQLLVVKVVLYALPLAPLLLIHGVYTTYTSLALLLGGGIIGGVAALLAVIHGLVCRQLGYKATNIL